MPSAQTHSLKSMASDSIRRELSVRNGHLPFAKSTKDTFCLYSQGVLQVYCPINMSFCNNGKIIRFLSESHFSSVLTLQSMKRLYSTVQNSLFLFIIMPCVPIMMILLTSPGHLLQVFRVVTEIGAEPSLPSSYRDKKFVLFVK
jgi:hypothetical protein